MYIERSQGLGVEIPVLYTYLYFFTQGGWG